MGNSDCCCEKTQELNIFSNLYDLFKQMITDLKDNDKNIPNDIYLIKVKSIPNFIKPIEESKILDNLKDGKEKEIIVIEKKLKKENQNYQLEKEIKIFSDYKPSKTISEKADEENEFIIVDLNFLEKMVENIDEYKNKKVSLIFDKSQSKMEIKFQSSNYSLKIKEKRSGIYEFKNEEDNGNSNFNPDTKIYL